MAETKQNNFTDTYFVDRMNKLIDYEGDIARGDNYYHPQFSPNNVQRLFFSKEGLAATYYACTSAKVLTWDFATAVRMCPNIKSPLTLLTSDRICKNIQEIYFLMDDNEMVSSRIFDFKSQVKLTATDGNKLRFPRLQGVFYISNYSFAECKEAIVRVTSFEKDLRYILKTSMLDYDCGFKALQDQGRVGRLNLQYNEDWREKSGLTGASISTYVGMEGEGAPLRNRMDLLIKSYKKSKQTEITEKTAEALIESAIKRESKIVRALNYVLEHSEGTVCEDFSKGMLSKYSNNALGAITSMDELGKFKSEYVNAFQNYVVGATVGRYLKDPHRRKVVELVFSELKKPNTDSFVCLAKFIKGMLPTHTAGMADLTRAIEEAESRR